MHTESHFTVTTLDGYQSNHIVTMDDVNQFCELLAYNNQTLANDYAARVLGIPLNTIKRVDVNVLNVTV